MFLLFLSNSYPRLVVRRYNLFGITQYIRPSLVYDSCGLAAFFGARHDETKRASEIRRFTLG